MAGLHVGTGGAAVPNRFELTLLAAERARSLRLGAIPLVTTGGHTAPVVALREIADGEFPPVVLRLLAMDRHGLNRGRPVVLTRSTDLEGAGLDGTADEEPPAELWHRFRAARREGQFLARPRSPLAPRTPDDSRFRGNDGMRDARLT